MPLLAHYNVLLLQSFRYGITVGQILTSVQGTRTQVVVAGAIAGVVSRYAHTSQRMNSSPAFLSGLWAQNMHILYHS